MAYEGNPNPLGNRLKHLRRAAGLSVDQVSERIGLAVETIRSHEKGARGVRPYAATKYARVYGVSVADLRSFPDETRGAGLVDLLRGLVEYCDTANEPIPLKLALHLSAFLPAAREAVKAEPREP